MITTTTSYCYCMSVPRCSDCLRLHSRLLSVIIIVIIMRGIEVFNATGWIFDFQFSKFKNVFGKSSLSPAVRYGMPYAARPVVFLGGRWLVRLPTRKTSIISHVAFFGLYCITDQYSMNVSRLGTSQQEYGGLPRSRSSLMVGKLRPGGDV